MRLKQLRTLKSTKPDELAKLLNISVQAYYKYESDKNEPSISTLCKLADLYNVSLDYLVGREFNDEIGYLSDQQRLAVNIIKQLNDMNLAKAIAYMSGMQAIQ